MKLSSKLLALILLLGIVDLAAAQQDAIPEPQEPKVAPASDEGKRAIAGFKLPSGWKGQLFAAEPMMANPVAIWVSEQGRVYVCETFRQNQGVEDNRSHAHWLDDDLATQTVEQRRLYIHKHLKESALDYTKQDDRVRLLEDANGDGRADKSQVFAHRFNDVVSGTGAGVLAVGGDVYYTCIPDLWLLRDTDGDGKADIRKSLLTGFGVRFAFRGHDLHGLIIGPDGRLYFSVGDRGYNVTAGGRRYANPESGAVFRCELDGSNFEVIHTGLRNPQELAFDDFGNLFTCDNNSDSGDKARLVYIVEGGDSGWRMAYQYLSDRGPFNREKLWHPFHRRQPAYIVPPVANIADGPSGLAYYPGVGFSKGFQGRFFLCDFRGGAANSGIRSFRVRPRGAFFELVDQDQPIWNILATDLAFGPDGAVYVSDWVHGWDGLGKGRIYRFADSQQARNPKVQEVQRLLAQGARKLDIAAMVKNLGHADQRIRLQAQFELVRRKHATALIHVARRGRVRLARLHALWGLSQIARTKTEVRRSCQAFLDLLDDRDAEVRGQTARQIGEVFMFIDRPDEALSLQSALVKKLRDPQPRVRFFAAMALGKAGRNPAAVEPLLTMLAENAGADPLLRHAGVMGLVGAGDDRTLAKATGHASPHARMGVLLAMRKLADPQIDVFLKDSQPRLVVEAARAIHDLPLDAAMPALAKKTTVTLQSDALARRVLNTNYRLGQPSHARALASYAANTKAAADMRLEALKMLANWSLPSPRDRVLGMWRPLPAREPKPAATALRGVLKTIFTEPDRIRVEAAKAAAKLGIREAGPALYQLAFDTKLSARDRHDALLALSLLKNANLREAVDKALQDNHPLIRSAGRRVLADLDPAAAIEPLEKAIDHGSMIERQEALAILAKSSVPAADDVVARAAQKLVAGKIPPDTQLDVLEAAQKRNTDNLRKLTAQFEASRSKNDPLAAFRELLSGGDASRGQEVYVARSEVSCVRCHKIGELGGEVGPDLTKIGADKNREYLLESLVLPDRTIAKGFQSIVAVTADGRIHNGILKHEDEKTLKLMTAQGELITLDKESIEEQMAGKSAMPDNVVKQLSRREIRDLVEFLARLRGQNIVKPQ